MNIKNKTYLESTTEKAIEYNLNICLAFVYFYKAFDSVDVWILINSLINSLVDSKCAQLIYTDTKK